MLSQTECLCFNKIDLKSIWDKIRTQSINITGLVKKKNKHKEEVSIAIY